MEISLSYNDLASLSAGARAEILDRLIRGPRVGTLSPEALEGEDEEYRGFDMEGSRRPHLQAGARVDGGGLGAYQGRTESVRRARPHYPQEGAGGGAGGGAKKGGSGDGNEHFSFPVANHCPYPDCNAQQGRLSPRLGRLGSRRRGRGTLRGDTNDLRIPPALFRLEDE